MPVHAGQMFAQCRLVQQIGAGGMGVVWKALDTSLNRHVAIKILPPDLMAAGPSSAHVRLSTGVRPRRRPHRPRSSCAGLSDRIPDPQLQRARGRRDVRIWQ